MKSSWCAAMRDGFAWLDPEKYGISVTPYFFGASGRVYPLTIEQLQAKSAADLEFDISQEAEDPGLTLEVSGPCPLHMSLLSPAVRAPFPMQLPCSQTLCTVSLSCACSPWRSLWRAAASECARRCRCIAV